MAALLSKRDFQPELYPSPGREPPLLFFRFQLKAGQAPRRYMEVFSTDLFSRIERKQKDGKVVSWPKQKQNPRFSEPAISYMERKQEEFEKFERQRIQNDVKQA